jgi:hypothetical protein
VLDLNAGRSVVVIGNRQSAQGLATLVAGNSDTLTLANHDDNRTGNATCTLFDDVSTH